MGTTTVLYKPGQLVRHKRYGYRGVIVSVDACCEADEAWYQSNQTQPDRNQITYPAQSSLIPDESCEKVKNPLLNHFFLGFEDGRYIRNDQPWPST